MNIRIAIVGIVLCAVLVPADAQQRRGTSTAAVERKLYCWEENGRKVCGDALPASAVDSARTEISPRSGLQVGQVGRALTAEERAAAEAQAARDMQAAEAVAAQERRELAMAVSYNTEADLRAAFGERIVLVDEALKTSRMGVTNLRLSLLSLLRQASDLELQEKPVPQPLANNILTQHNDLLRQQAIMSQQLDERASLDADLEYAVERYRALRGTQQDG
ncbi:hypothetical protein E2F46_15490 [Luteimonas aestuarii]|uniref:DUF4124 domain-containing protein n=1 Tax=Luteimonas aestuarii TaxID=453837 RepID=A0A4R5TKZ2_9GAMM|nr:hypothetical protein [Luteimonas aestuarii]TDK21097.1 hypothetical protein E2F46_15490 [Luteimonas aestuarii]